MIYCNATDDGKRNTTGRNTMKTIDEFMSYYIGEDWKDIAIQSMLIGLGGSCLVFLFTALVCSGI